MKLTERIAYLEDYKPKNFSPRRKGEDWPDFIARVPLSHAMNSVPGYKPRHHWDWTERAFVPNPEG